MAIYRRVFAASCRQLPLRGVDVGASDPQGEQKQLNLDHVYVSLNTTTRIESGEDEQPRKRQPSMEREEARPLGALEAAHANRRLVLTGDPGSGKSTFVNHLGLCLAMHGLEPKAGWLDKLEPWSAQEANLLPVTVILRDFARFAVDEGNERSPNRLWSFIRSRLKRQNLDFVAEHLHDRLEAGEVYLLLDGLDEIAVQSQRTVVRDAVAAFAVRYDRCRILVTCRTLSYQDPAWRLPSFPSYELAPFDDEQIGHFVDAWYGELQQSGRGLAGGGDAVDRASARGHGSARPAPAGLQPAAAHGDGAGPHPQGAAARRPRPALRGDDRDPALALGTGQGRQRKGSTAPARLLLDAGRTDVDLKKVLWRLAFDAHGEGGTDATKRTVTKHWPTSAS